MLVLSTRRTRQTIKNDQLKMTQRNIPLPHPPSNSSVPTPTFKVFADIHPPPPQVPSTPLPPKPSQHTPPLLLPLESHMNPLYYNSVLLQTPPLQTFFLIPHHLPQSPFLIPRILLLLLQEAPLFSLNNVPILSPVTDTMQFTQSLNPLNLSHFINLCFTSFTSLFSRFVTILFHNTL